MPWHILTLLRIRNTRGRRIGRRGTLHGSLHQECAGWRWLNQFVTGREHVDPYHECGATSSPAAAAGQHQLLAPDATVQVALVAIDPALIPRKEGITTDRISQPLAGGPQYLLVHPVAERDEVHLAAGRGYSTCSLNSA